MFAVGREHMNPKEEKGGRLDNYFEARSMESAICRAIEDGHSIASIAEFLNLSKSYVLKIARQHRHKTALFNRLKEKGIFWSYGKNLTYDEAGGDLLVEYALKYADFDDIKLCLKLFGKKKTKAIWDKTMRDDKSFIKTNLMIARVFFSMNVESDYFKEIKNARLEKLRLLAS